MGLKAQKQHDIKFPDLDSSRTLQPKPRSFLPDSVAGFCMRELQSPSYKSPCGRGHLVAVDTPSHRRWGLQWDRQGVTTQAPHGPPGSPFFLRSRPRVTGSGGASPQLGERRGGEGSPSANPTLGEHQHGRRACSQRSPPKPLPGCANPEAAPQP